MTTLQTKRLILRPWKESDLEPFARLNADPRVMEFFPSVLTREKSDAMVLRVQAKIEQRGWGWWAVSAPGVEELMGFIGMDDVDAAFPFAPAVEIGWRLKAECWGRGYASEGALACLRYGFETLGLEEIVAFTAVQNIRSQSVMKKIGMHRDPKDDFDHSKLPEGHWLRRHVLYRIRKDEWYTQMNSNLGF